MPAFFAALFLICASTLMYEVVLTRLLSVISWYYLAFVSVSMGMFGMTLGALVVQLLPDRFDAGQAPGRMAQAARGMAISLPLSLLTMLAIPLELSAALETLYSFVLFCAVISVPFFFSGIAVCLSLTRTSIPIGRVYAVDLLGAAAGCLGAVVLLRALDAPSAIFAIAGMVFLSAAAYAHHAGEDRGRRRAIAGALAMILVAGLNSLTLHGIQPIWSKGVLDRRIGLLAEVWNPISKVRVYRPQMAQPLLWGASPHTPQFNLEEIVMDIDNDAVTTMIRDTGNSADFDFLRYDVTSVAAGLRPGGSAAIIGVGGGRDVRNAARNGFQRIVGIEVNPAIVDLDRELDAFSGFSRIAGFELHADEGRSFLTRVGEKFDLIQASLVDTFAATSAGALTLSENSLYTVEGWRVFYEHLKPGGLISFSRWNQGVEAGQTARLFAVAWATLLSEGVAEPAAHIALLGAGQVATIVVSNAPLSASDLDRLRAIAREMDFQIVFFPGEPTSVNELRAIAAARSLEDLRGMRDPRWLDFSPVYDSSPFFFNAVHLENLPTLFRSGGGEGGNLRALLFLLCFLLAAFVLVILTIVCPLVWRSDRAGPRPLAGGVGYFVLIGLGFMLVEMAMMQQLSIFLGHPIYSLVVVLTGLILSAGAGSQASEKLRLGSSWSARGPALASVAGIFLYLAAVLPVIHRFVAGVLWQRAIFSLALIMPAGFLMGFCFPVGLRWMKQLGQERNLPWMWALNGAASVLASFIAMLISMETSIPACVLTGAACYLLAAGFLPRRA